LACRRIAAGLVAAKIRNQRTLLRRNWKDGEAEDRDAALDRLKRLARTAETAPPLPELLGVEGEAAAIHFRRFERMIAPERRLAGFAFERRNRRPPEDPINALLSFAYALATRAFATALEAAGLDPLLGFLHQPRPGRPALALDMM